jgi:hypothetical protein
VELLVVQQPELAERVAEEMVALLLRVQRLV